MDFQCYFRINQLIVDNWGNKSADHRRLDCWLLIIETIGSSKLYLSVLIISTPFGQ